MESPPENTFATSPGGTASSALVRVWQKGVNTTRDGSTFHVRGKRASSSLDKTQYVTRGESIALMPRRQTSRSSHHVPRCQVQSLMTTCPAERRLASTTAVTWSIRPDPFRRTASYSLACLKRRSAKPTVEKLVRSRTSSPDCVQSWPRRLLKSAGTVVRTRCLHL